MATFVSPTKVNTDPPFFGMTPVIPQFYWDVESAEERIKKLCQYYQALLDYANELGIATNENADIIDDMQEVIDSIENGEYTSQYIDGLAAWIDKNLTQLVGRIASYVFPQFYWDGNSWRFSLVIPENWAWLKFTFPAVETENEYSYHISLCY